MRASHSGGITAAQAHHAVAAEGLEVVVGHARHRPILAGFAPEERLRVIEFEGLLGLALLGFWLWALLDCIVSPRDEVRNLPKLVWLLLIVLLWVIGATAWAFLGRTAPARQRRPRSLDREGARRPLRADDLPAALAAADTGAMTDARSAELDRRIEEWEAQQAPGRAEAVTTRPCCRAETRSDPAPTRRSGAEGNRTPDPFHAMEVLYQLSYSPSGRDNIPAPRRGSRFGRRSRERLGAGSGQVARGAAGSLAAMSDARPAPDAPAFRYNARLANEIEAKWQDRWEQERTFWAPNPTGELVRRLRRGGRPHQALRARHVPVPERRGPPRRAPARLHRHRRVRPLQADDRPQRAPRHGLRRVRPARRAVRGADRPAPARHHRGEHRQHAPPAAGARPRPRPAPRGGHHRRRLLPLDAVDLPADLRLLVRRRGGRRPGRSRSSSPSSSRARARPRRRRRRRRRRREAVGASSAPTSSAPSSTRTASPTSTRRR